MGQGARGRRRQPRGSLIRERKTEEGDQVPPPFVPVLSLGQTNAVRPTGFVLTPR